MSRSGSARLCPSQARGTIQFFNPIPGVLLHPLNQLRIVRRIPHTTTRNEEYVCSWAVFKSVVGSNFLTKDRVDWIGLFSDGEDFIACSAEYFPRSREVNNFGMIE